MAPPPEPCRRDLGEDFAATCGHVHRVLTHALHFLGEEAARHRRAVEVAAAFNDIGLWTDDALACPEPSTAVTLREKGERRLGIDPALLAAMIREHHKVAACRGPLAVPVEAFRKADWVDASGGLVRHGLSRAAVKAVSEAIRDQGFPRVLLRLVGDLSGGSCARGLAPVLRKGYRL